MKIALIIAAALVIILLVVNAAQQVSEDQFDVDSNIADVDLTAGELPDERSFLMGFTYQPWDWNKAASEQTFAYLRKHGDLITLFHDVGIPWEESFRQTPYPVGLETDLQRQAAGAADFEHVVVMLSCLAPDRISLAPAITDAGTVDRAGEWAHRTFDHPDVIKAYLNHARDLIRRFQPKYFGYVAEVDAAFVDVNDERFRRLLTFSETVYGTLKNEHPDLNVFAEFTLGNNAYMSNRQDVIDAMLPLTDLYAVSTYADIADGIGGDASKIPADWFARTARLAPSKPFAVMESGFIAEHFRHPSMGIRVRGWNDRLLIPGGPKSQALFTVRLLQAAQELDAEFINLWAVRDLDQLFEHIVDDELLSDPMWKTAQDRGLYDETGTPRPSLKIWDAWSALRYSR